MIEKLILKYEAIRDDYRYNSRKYKNSNDELYHRYRLRADDFDYIIYDLKKLKNKL